MHSDVNKSTLEIVCVSQLDDNSLNTRNA